METRSASIRMNKVYNLRFTTARSSSTFISPSPAVRRRCRNCTNSTRHIAAATEKRCKSKKIPDPDISARTKGTRKNTSNNDNQAECTVPPPSEEEDVKCSICLDTEIFATHLHTLVCGHTFHENCFEIWYQVKQHCPMCRAPVDPISLHYLSRFRYFMNNIAQWAMRSIAG